MSLEFAKLGSTVVGWDISAKGLQETEEILKEENLDSKWRAYKCDLTNRHQVYEIADKVGHVSVNKNKCHKMSDFNICIIKVRLSLFNM